MFPQTKLALFSTYLLPRWRPLVLLLLLLATSAGLQAGNPQLLGFFLDQAIGNGTLWLLLLTASLFLALGLLQQVLSILTASISGHLSWATTNQVRTDIVAHCLRLDLAFHTARTPGELLERTDEDVTALNTLLSSFLPQIIVNLLLLISVLVVLFLTDWLLGVALGAYALLFLLVLSRSRGKVGPAWSATWEARAQWHGFVGELVTAIADMRGNGAIPYSMRRFYEARRRAFLAYWRAHRISMFLFGGTDVLLVVGTVGAFVLAALLAQAGRISPGMVYVVVTYAKLVSGPLDQLMSQIDDVQQANASLKRLRELFAFTPEVQDGPGVSFPAGALSLRFDDVSFAYQPDTPVLRHISFALQPGEVLGVLGRTGSGKTTLSRLLLRLYEPTSGTLQLGGIDIKVARLDELRRQIGLVTQDVQLFHATLRDNLTLFDRSIDDQQVLQALCSVGLDTWYASLPRGLDTLIAAASSEEAGLSAGEAQLLAFARVFLRHPALVVLDEASSRLDPETSRLIEQALDTLFMNRTGIIIAHRLSTIQRADRILILEQGQVIEYGTRQDLLHNPNSRLNRLLHIGLEELYA